MSLSQVEAILGRGESTSQAALGELSGQTTTYCWSSGVETISVSSFQDKVIAKNLNGL